MRQYRRVSPILTATAVCRRASSIKVRISINNSRGPWLFRSRSRCVILPFYYAHPVVIPIGTNAHCWSGGLRGRVPQQQGATGCCTPLPGGVNERLWAGPTQTSPLATWCHVCPHFARKYRPLGRFCRLSRLVSTVPSIVYGLTRTMAWKRLVRSRSGPPMDFNTLQMRWSGRIFSGPGGGLLRLAVRAKLSRLCFSLLAASAAFQSPTRSYWCPAPNLLLPSENHPKPQIACRELAP